MSSHFLPSANCTARRLALAGLLGVTLVAPSVSHAQPTFSLSAPRPKVIDGIRLEERTYSTAGRWLPVSRARASYSTPEAAFTAHMSAMLSGDHEWWLSGWTRADRLVLAETDKKANRSPVDWRRIWQEALAGQLFEVVSRVEYGDYVLLHYRLIDSQGRPTFQSRYACKRESGKWLATNDLADDPVFAHFFGAPVIHTKKTK